VSANCAGKWGSGDKGELELCQGAGKRLEGVGVAWNGVL